MLAVSHTHTEGEFVHGCGDDAFRTGQTGGDLSPPSALCVYSHFRHRAHVLYYLWSRSGTAHCSSPASYQEFAPGKLIRGERRRGYGRRAITASQEANEDHC